MTEPWPVTSTYYHDEDGKPISKAEYQEKLHSGYYSNFISMTSGSGIMVYGLHRREVPCASLIGKPFPQFKFTDLDGKTWTTRKMKGEVTVLHFWSTTCGSCIRELPFLNDLRKSNPGTRWFSLAIDNREKLKSFLQKHAVGYPVAAIERPDAAAIGIQSYPVTLVLDRDGILQDVLMGAYQDTLLLQQKISKHLVMPGND